MKNKIYGIAAIYNRSKLSQIEIEKYKNKFRAHVNEKLDNHADYHFSDIEVIMESTKEYYTI